MKTDILIIGGGVIGLSIACELGRRRAGSVTLVETGICGQESSWAAAGMLGPQAEADEFGRFFDLCCRSRDMYPSLAAALLDETGIDVELDRAGTMCVAFTDEDSARLQRRSDQQRAAGLKVEHLSADDVRQAEPFLTPDVREALYFADDWQVDNRKLLLALRRSAELNGVAIVEGTSVERLVIDGDLVTGVETGGGERIESGMTVLASGAWTSLITLGESSPLPNIRPIRGQIAAFHLPERKLRRVVYSPRGYLVPRADGRVLAGSTSEDVGFEKRVTENAVDGLLHMAIEIAPTLSETTMEDSWCGFRPFAPDSLPVIGPFLQIGGLIAATGHYRNGILLTPVTAQIVAEAIVDGVARPEFAEFGPQRFSSLAAVAAE